MLDSGPISTIDAPADPVGARAVSASHGGWITCSPLRPWGVHSVLFGRGACTRCGWSPKAA